MEYSGKDILKAFEEVLLEETPEAIYLHPEDKQALLDYVDGLTPTFGLDFCEFWGVPVLEMKTLDKGTFAVVTDEIKTYRFVSSTLSLQEELERGRG